MGVAAVTGVLSCTTAVWPLSQAGEGYIPATTCQTGTTHCYKRLYTQLSVPVHEQGCDTQNLCASVPASTTTCCTSGGASLICSTSDFMTSVVPSDFSTCPQCHGSGGTVTSP